MFFPTLIWLVAFSSLHDASKLCDQLSMNIHMYTFFFIQQYLKTVKVT